MTPFVGIATLLIVVAMAFVWWPLRRGANRAEPDRRSENLALYRQRVDELRRDQQLGSVDEDSLAALLDERAAALLEDETPRTEPLEARAADRADWLVPAALGLALPVLAVVLYMRLGAGDAVGLANAAELLRSSVDRPVALAELVVNLERRVAEHPDEVESWYLLGHARMRERNYRAAAASFARLLELGGADSNVLVSLIQAEFLADGGRVSPTNRERIDHLLSSTPGQPLVLEMLAMDAIAGNDPETAVGYLERALAGGATGARGQALRAELARTRALAGMEPGPALDVSVSGLRAIPGLTEQAVLFVLARRPGERMPRMVARREISADRIAVRLDATTVMGEQPPLRPGESLEVVARVSRSGDVRPDPGDVEVVSELVSLAARPVPMSLSVSPAPLVSGPVSGAVPGTASEKVSERVPATASTTPGSTGDVPSISVELRADAGVEAAPDSRIFVIVRAPEGPPMPVAVRALRFADLPVALRLTDSDAMQAGRALSQFDQVVVLARLSRSGTPTRQPGDLETQVLSARPAEQPLLQLVLQ